MFFRFASLTSVLVVLAQLASAQVPQRVEIETANLLIYRHDVSDATRLATDAGPTTPLPIRAFMNVTWIGDVVAVNGTPAKGSVVVRGTFFALNPNPVPGTGVGDNANSIASDWIFDIQRADGRPIGTIVATGWAFGSRAAGLSEPGQGNLAVVGGTGAFFGLRGQVRELSAATGSRAFASILEDPANRRIHGGRSIRYMFHVVPGVQAAFAASAGNFGVFHSDFSPVTTSNPAKRGEVLIAAVTGLGPTAPGKQPDAPFPADILQEVVAPIQVAFNGGAPVNPINQIGWPGTVGLYRLDFRVPDDIPAGMVSIQLTSAWLAGGSTMIPLQ